MGLNSDCKGTEPLVSRYGNLSGGASLNSGEREIRDWVSNIKYRRCGFGLLLPRGRNGRGGERQVQKTYADSHSCLLASACFAFSSDLETLVVFVVVAAGGGAVDGSFWLATCC